MVPAVKVLPYKHTCMLTRHHAVSMQASEASQAMTLSGTGTMRRCLPVPWTSIWATAGTDLYGRLEHIQHVSPAHLYCRERTHTRTLAREHAQRKQVHACTYADTDTGTDTDTDTDTGTGTDTDTDTDTGTDTDTDIA